MLVMVYQGKNILFITLVFFVELVIKNQELINFVLMNVFGVPEKDLNILQKLLKK